MSIRKACVTIILLIAEWKIATLKVCSSDKSKGSFDIEEYASRINVKDYSSVICPGHSNKYRNYHRSNLVRVTIEPFNLASLQADSNTVKDD